MYASLYFVLKSCVYSFLLWLQTYLSEELNYTTEEGAAISTVSDIGAMIGGLSLGFVSDKLYGRRGPVAFVSVIIPNVSMYLIAFGI